MNKKRLVKIFECKKVVKPLTTTTAPESKISFLQKKRIRFKSQEGYRNGRWSLLEQENFLKSCSNYGNNWKKIQQIIKTRSCAQIRSHAQKYLNKLCKKYRIKLIPKTLRKKGKIFVDVDGDWYDFSKSKVPVDQIEKKILEMFNKTYSCFRFNSKKNLKKDKKQKSFFNRFFFMKQKNVLNLNLKVKKKKVFNIKKLYKDNQSFHRSSFVKSLEEIRNINFLVLNELTKDSFDVEPMIGELIDDNDSIQSLTIDTDQQLKKDVEKDIGKIFNFFAAINNMQNKVREKLNNIFNGSFQALVDLKKAMENHGISNNFPDLKN